MFTAVFEQGTMRKHEVSAFLQGEFETFSTFFLRLKVQVRLLIL